MAVVTQQLASGGGDAFEVDIVFDDVTGEIQQLAWTISQPGTLTVLIHNPPKPDIARTLTSSGSQNVPAGQYFMSPYKGGWAWLGNISFTETWKPG